MPTDRTDAEREGEQVPPRLASAIAASLVLFVLVSCASAAAPPPARALPPLPFHQRLLTETDLSRGGWILAEFRPDHPIVAAIDPNETPCDGSYSAELGSNLERTIASRTFVADGSVLHESIISGVTARDFSEFTDAVAACDGVAGSATINDIPTDVLSTQLDLGLPPDAFAMTVLVASEYDASISVWMYARTPDDTLLTLSLLHPSLPTPELATLLEQAIRKARGLRA